MGRTRTDEQRARWAQYQREYRRKNPERARAWMEKSILKRAAAIMAARAEERGQEQEGDVHDGEAE